ncbi:unnamed protein product [Pedinophyceae sp. YPF-701]|nr:unnamed protein product [Pedinophyceae sp. YPF-701]
MSGGPPRPPDPVRTNDDHPDEALRTAPSVRSSTGALSPTAALLPDAAGAPAPATRHDALPASRAPGAAPPGKPGAGGAGAEEEEAVFTVDDALSDMGFGKWQLLVLFYCGVAWSADAMEMMLLSFLGPEAQCEWGLGPWAESLLTTVVFLGMMLGSNIWGSVSDSRGRRAGFFASALFTCIFGLLAALAPNYGMLLLLRGLTGLGMGGFHVAFALLAEFIPKRHRGQVLVAVAVFWTIGSMMEGALAWVVLPSLNWRWLVGLSSIPLWLLMGLYPLVPESPHFLLSTGDSDRARKVLEGIARWNHTQVPQGRLVTAEEKKEVVRAAQEAEEEEAAEYWATPVGLVTTASFRRRPESAEESPHHLRKRGSTDAHPPRGPWVQTQRWHDRDVADARASPGGTGAAAAAGGTQAGGGGGEEDALGRGTHAVQGQPWTTAYDPNGDVTVVAAAGVTYAADAGERWGRQLWQDLKDSMQVLYPPYREVTVLLLTVWFASACTYYGVVLLATSLRASEGGCRADGRPNLTADDYRDIFVTSVAELPGIVLAFFAVDWLGRIYSLAGGLALTALAILPLLMISSSHKAAMTGLLFVSRCLVLSTFQVAWIYTPEVFPTDVRSFALGLTNGFARVGGLVSPFVSVALVESGLEEMAEALFLTLCLVGAAAALCLPIETAGRGLDHEYSADDLQAKWPWKWSLPGRRGARGAAGGSGKEVGLQTFAEPVPRAGAQNGAVPAPSGANKV